MNKEKAKKLLNALQTAEDRTSGVFSELEKQMAEVSKSLLSAVNLKTAAQVEQEIKRFQKSLIPISESIKSLQKISEENISKIKDEFSGVFEEIDRKTEDVRNTIVYSEAGMNVEIFGLKQKLDSFSADRKQEVESLSGMLLSLNQETDSLLERIKKIESKKETDYQDQIDKISKSLSEAQELFTTRINNLGRGGGNMNRNIAVGGNQSTLARYTDINLKAGSNVTITYSNNDTTKYTDITISSSGGGSSVGGTVRSINRISTSQTAGATSGTDYAYICAAGVNLTLPTAVSNTNLYTVKNSAASSVLITTTAAQTIDGDSSVLLATQYSEVSLLNDGNDNWMIGI